MSEKIFLIINPISGTHPKDKLRRRVVEALRQHGFEVTTALTEYSGHASELAREAVKAGYSGVLACGGDGTVNEVASAMINTGVPMGILPSGSGNGLARHLLMPIDAIRAVDIIGRRCIRDCDCGIVNNTPFFCTFGVGFDATVSDRFAEASTRGALTYVKSALQEFASYKPVRYHIDADGEVFDDDAFLVAVCNANQYGNNAYIAPRASITDGKLNLVIVRKIPRFDTVMLGIEMLCGTLAENHGVLMREASSITIERKGGGPAHMDGEPLVDVGDKIVIECRPGALKLFTNPDKPPFRPLITPLQSVVSDVGTSLRNLFEEL